MSLSKCAKQAVFLEFPSLSEQEKELAWLIEESRGFRSKKKTDWGRIAKKASVPLKKQLDKHQRYNSSSYGSLSYHGLVHKDRRTHFMQLRDRITFSMAATIGQPAPKTHGLPISTTYGPACSTGVTNDTESVHRAHCRRWDHASPACFRHFFGQPSLTNDTIPAKDQHESENTMPHFAPCMPHQLIAAENMIQTSGKNNKLPTKGLGHIRRRKVANKGVASDRLASSRRSLRRTSHRLPPQLLELATLWNRSEVSNKGTVNWEKMEEHASNELREKIRNARRSIHFRNSPMDLLVTFEHRRTFSSLLKNIGKKYRTTSEQDKNSEKKVEIVEKLSTVDDDEFHSRKSQFELPERRNSKLAKDITLMDGGEKDEAANTFDFEDERPFPIEGLGDIAGDNRELASASITSSKEDRECESERCSPWEPTKFGTITSTKEGRESESEKFPPWEPTMFGRLQPATEVESFMDIHKELAYLLEMSRIKLGYSSWTYVANQSMSAPLREWYNTKLWSSHFQPEIHLKKFLGRNKATANAFRKYRHELRKRLKQISYLPPSTTPIPPARSDTASSMLYNSSERETERLPLFEMNHAINSASRIDMPLHGVPRMAQALSLGQYLQVVQQGQGNTMLWQTVPTAFPPLNPVWEREYNNLVVYNKLQLELQLSAQRINALAVVEENLRVQRARAAIMVLSNLNNM